MTATRYASIALSGRVVACGNSIFKLSETTPNNLIGRCRRKIAPHLHRIQHFPTFIGRFAQNGGLVTMAWLPLKCMVFKYRVAHNGVMGFHRYSPHLRSLSMASHCGFQGILFLPPPFPGLRLSSGPRYWTMRGFSHLSPLLVTDSLSRTSLLGCRRLN